MIDVFENQNGPCRSEMHMSAEWDTASADFIWSLLDAVRRPAGAISAFHVMQAEVELYRDIGTSLSDIAAQEGGTQLTGSQGR